MATLVMEPEDGELPKPGASLEEDKGSTTLQYKDMYEQKDRLASGSFGTVYIAEHRSTKAQYAVKVVDRSRLSEKDHDLVNREVGILKDCRDIESIVRLVDFFESPTHYYVVQVYARGGTCVSKLRFRGKTIDCVQEFTIAFDLTVDGQHDNGLYLQGTSLKDWPMSQFIPKSMHVIWPSTC